VVVDGGCHTIYCACLDCITSHGGNPPDLQRHEK
jgi:hypothetical protein